jgi:hypothetical protein
MADPERFEWSLYINQSGTTLLLLPAKATKWRLFVKSVGNKQSWISFPLND